MEVVQKRITIHSGWRRRRRRRRSSTSPRVTNPCPGPFTANPYSGRYPHILHYYCFWYLKVLIPSNFSNIPISHLLSVRPSVAFHPKIGTALPLLLDLFHLKWTCVLVCGLLSIYTKDSNKQQIGPNWQNFLYFKHNNEWFGCSLSSDRRINKFFPEGGKSL